MPGQNLTRDEARTRAELLVVDAHRVDLDVSGAADRPTFPVTSTITFTCRQPGASTFLDFIGPSVEALLVNFHDALPVEAEGLAAAASH